MINGTTVALALVLAVAGALAFTRARASLDEGPVQLADGRVVSKQPWVAGRQWLLPDVPCTEPECARERGRRRVAALRARGWVDYASCVPTAEVPWLVLGRRGGMPVVYIAGQGTVVMSPSEVEAHRRPAVPGGPSLCF